MIIYKTTNLINGKIYIGQDRNNNPNYLGSGAILKKSIKKYGRENFKKEILDVCESIEELNLLEIYWISKLNSQDSKIGYNISSGGAEGDREAGYKIFEEGVFEYWSRVYGEDEAIKRKDEKNKKISEINKKNQPNLITKGRFKIWEEKYGYDIAILKYNEWKKKISDYQKYKLENGWTHSEESRKKIGDSSKGRKMSEETKIKMRKPKPAGFSEKISKIKKGKSTGPSKKRIKIEQYDLYDIFIRDWDCINDAECELKIYNISYACNGKQKTAGGFKWKYKI